MSGPRCFMPSHTPVESTDITASQCSTVSSSTVARLPMPALLTSPSRRPCSLRTRSATPTHCASSATSRRAVRCRPDVPSSSPARVRHAGLVEVGQHQVSALLREPLRHGPPQPTGGPGQEHHLVPDPVFDLRHVVLTHVFPVVRVIRPAPARRRAARSPRRRAVARRPAPRHGTAPPRPPGAESPCSASSTTATRSSRAPQNGALTCQPSGSASPLPTTMLPRAPPTTTSRPPGTRADPPAAMVWSEPTKSRTTSAAGPGHRLLDRGPGAVRAEVHGQRAGLGPRVDGDHVCGRGRTEDLHGQVPESADTDHERRALPGQRVPLGADRVVGGEPGVGQRRQHGRRDPVGGHEVALVGQQDVVGQAPVAAQPAPDPALEGDAVVVPAAPAVVALTARPDAVHHAVPADERAVGRLAHRHDPARHLVAEGQRKVVRQGAALARHHEEVGVTQADGADLEQDLAPPRRGDRHLDQLHRPAPVEQAVRRHHLGHGQDGTCGPRPPTDAR